MGAGSSVSSSRSNELFALLDLNEDGKLDQKEVMVMFEAFEAYDDEKVREGVQKLKAEAMIKVAESSTDESKKDGMLDPQELLHWFNEQKYEDHEVVKLIKLLKKKKQPEEQAAVVLQGVQRRQSAKKEVQEKREQKNAAVAIQNAHRVKEAKKTVEAKRAEKLGQQEATAVEAKEPAEAAAGAPAGGVEGEGTPPGAAAPEAAAVGEGECAAPAADAPAEEAAAAAAPAEEATPAAAPAEEATPATAGALEEVV